MTRSSAALALPVEPVDEGEGEEEEGEEAEGEEAEVEEEQEEAEDMSTHGGGSDLGSEDEGEEEDEEVEEEEVIEMEEEEEEVEEEEEDGGEEEIEEGEEDDEEGEGEEEQVERGSGADSPADSVAPADEGTNDATQQMEFEREDEDLQLSYSSTQKSEAKSMSDTLFEGALVQKETSAEIPSVKNGHEILGEMKDFIISTEIPESSHLKEKELIGGTQKRCRNGDLDGILPLEKEVSDPERTMDQRPRSPVSGFLEKSNKRPATVCTFFARGWCIKGNSCRFLHQKDGDDASPLAQENLTGPNSQINLKADRGIKHEADQSYTSHETLTSAAEDSAATSLQRALVRAYGGHELHRLQDKDSESLSQMGSSLGSKACSVGVQLAAANSNFFPDSQGTTFAEGPSNPGSGPPSLQFSEFPRTSLIQTEHGKSYDAHSVCGKLDSYVNSIDGGQSVTRGFNSGKYLGEGKAHYELSKLEHASNGSFSGVSPVTRTSLISEYKYCSTTSLTSSSIYQRSSTPHVNDMSAANHIAQFQGLPSLHDPKIPYCTKGLFNSTFHSPLSHVQSLSSSLTRDAFQSTRGSTPVDGDDIGSYKRMDHERRYHLSRSSSPLSQFGPETFQWQEIVERTSVSSEKKVESFRDAWEPSMPFRSYFYCPPPSISSPGSQYDPLSDSIEPPQSLSNQRKSTDNVPRGSHSPGYNDLNLQTSLRKSRESMVSKTNFEYGASGYPSSSAGASGLGTVDGATRNSLLKDKSWSPGHVIDFGNVKEMDYEGNPRNREDKGRQHKETKALKNFRACLVEFVKDLLKPAWREGHLSKDAHKMVVKKAAEKVLSTLQPYQIPNTMDAINQYLSASRPKIVKLVEGYVDKYAKS